MKNTIIKEASFTDVRKLQRFAALLNIISNSINRADLLHTIKKNQIYKQFNVKYGKAVAFYDKDSTEALIIVNF